MEGLGDLPGGSFSSLAEATSADGSVVVGYSSAAAGARAFVWDAVNGMRDLNTVLTDLGADLTGYTLDRALGVSSDGTKIVGWATGPNGQEAFLADLGSAPPDTDGDGVNDDDDNCPEVANPGQTDTDLDGAGDACNDDDDNDGVADGSDNCQFTANPGQIDLDGDGLGRARSSRRPPRRAAAASSSASPAGPNPTGPGLRVRPRFFRRVLVSASGARGLGRSLRDSWGCLTKNSWSP